MGEFSGSACFELPHLMRLHDADELNHAVSGSNLELLQLKAGRLDARLGHVSLGDFCLDQGMVDVPMRARGELDRRRYGLAIYHSKARATWNGHPVDQSRVLYFMPGRELDGHTAGDYGWVSMVIPPEWIESIEQTARRAALLQMPRDCRTFQPATHIIMELWQAAAEVASAESADPGSEAALWCASNLRNAFGAALLAADDPYGKELARTLAHYSVARRAERMFRERMTEPLCVDDVCVALRVSRRYLEYAFADAFGASPSRYLRLLRLHEVRRRLRKFHSTTTVTREALAVGFNHLSLFSVQYKKIFGETPSQTLAGASLQECPQADPCAQEE